MIAARHPRTRASQSLALPPFVELCQHAGPALLPLLSTADAVSLRSICRALRTVVAEHPWDDSLSPILELVAWRASFPRARAALLKSRSLTASDFALLAGVGAVHIRDCSPVDAAAQAAWFLLSRATALHVLVFGGADGHGERLHRGACAAGLTTALTQSVFPRLAVLNATGSSIGAGMAALAAALSRGAAPRLETLDLSAKGIRLDGFVALSGALLGGAVPLLKALDVSSNLDYGWGAVCAQAVADALPGVPLLESLGVSTLRMGVGGALALAEQLGCVPRLQVLQLSRNAITDEGVLAIAEVLASRRLPGLLKLGLAGNEVTAVGMGHLAAALGSGCTPLLVELGLHSTSLAALA